jgi:hypothetical protein
MICSGMQKLVKGTTGAGMFVGAGAACKGKAGVGCAGNGVGEGAESRKRRASSVCASFA